MGFGPAAYHGMDSSSIDGGSLRSRSLGRSLLVGQAEGDSSHEMVVKIVFASCAILGRNAMLGSDLKSGSRWMLLLLLLLLQGIKW